MGDLYNPFPKLPKNIRQIGERDQTVRLYLEDYVNTYLKRLFPKGGQDLRAGVLLGTAEERDGLPYLFVDGAMEVEDITEPGEKVQFTEQAWRKTYQAMEQMFPKRVVLGWFLCGAPGCTLSPLNYWKEHGKYFAGKNQLMYLNGGLDGEEAVYVAGEDGFCRLRGYSVYYERNQMMQDYMILRKDVRRVETGTGDPVIRDFRQRMEENKSQVTARRGTVRVLGSLCTALGVLVLAGGVTMLNNYEKMQEMEAVLASVLPAGALGEDAAGGSSGSGLSGQKENGEGLSGTGGQASQVVVEEIKGNLEPSVGGNGGLTADGAEGAAGTGFAAGDAAESDAGNGSADGAGSAAGNGAAGNGMNFGNGAESEDESAVGNGLAAGNGTNVGSGAAAGNGSVAGGNTDGAGASGAGSSAGTGSAGESAAAAGGSGEQFQTAEAAESAASAREVLAGQSLYLVQPGDTLYGICLDHYGSGAMMQEICELNGLEDENTINAGENLILP